MSRFGKFIASISSRFSPDEESRTSEPVDYEESVTDRTIVSTGEKITPEMLLGWLRSAESGDPRRLFAFYDEMRARDAHLDAELNKATRALTGAKIDVLPYPASLRDRANVNTAEARRAGEIATYIKDQILAPDIRLDRVITALCGGFWKGLAAMEVEVVPGGAPGGKELLKEVCEIPAQRFRYLPMSTELMYQPTGDAALLFPVEDLQKEGRLVLLLDDPHNPNPARRGLLRRVIATWIIRNQGLRWWSRYVELFGVPYRVGKHASNDEKTKKALVDAAQNAGAAGWAVIPDSASLEFLNATVGTAGTNSHEGLLEWCAREMSKVINGATQTTDVQSGSGSKASASVHADQMQALAESRAIEIAATIRQQLVRPLVVRNFGEDAAFFTPEIRIRVEDEEDLLVMSQAIKNLTDAGVSTLPTEWFHAKSGIPMPVEGEATITKAVVAPFGQATLPAAATNIIPFRAAAATPTVDPLVSRAEKLAPGAAEEIVGPYRAVIDKAVEEGVDLTTVLVRVLHHARVDIVSPERLQDLLAAVMVDATMRGIVDQRKERGRNA